jgi:ferredoxin
MASEVFGFGDDGLAENILGEEVPAGLEDSVKEAAESCPVAAIETE